MQDCLPPLKQLIALKLPPDDFFSLFRTCRRMKADLSGHECYYQARVKQLSYFEPDPAFLPLSTYEKIFNILVKLWHLKGNYYTLMKNMHMVRLVLKTPHFLYCYFTDESHSGSARSIIEFMDWWKPLQAELFDNQYLRELLKHTLEDWMCEFCRLITQHPEFFGDLLKHPDLIDTVIVAFGSTRGTAPDVHFRICNFVEERYKVHPSITQPVRTSSRGLRRQECLQKLFMHLSEDYRTHNENNPDNVIDLSNDKVAFLEIHARF